MPCKALKKRSTNRHFRYTKARMTLLADSLSMKIMDLNIVSDIQSAKHLEQEGRLEAAAKLYEDAVKRKSPDEHPYNRLMIIYRRLKRPKDELRVIKAGISVFEASLKPKRSSRKLAELSKAMMKSTGLTDKKGNLVYHPEPIGRWIKRKLVVEKKLGK